MNPTDPDSPGSGADPKERLERAGRDTASSAKAEARSRMEEGKDTAASTADHASEALDETAANLSAEGKETLAEGAHFLASRLSSLADQLEHRSVDELTSEARRLARTNPGLFVAGGVALGLALTRFFKASAPEHRTTSARGDASDAKSPGTAGAVPASPSSSQRLQEDRHD